MTQYSKFSDVRGNVTEAVKVSDDNHAATLAASTELTLTVPSKLNRYLVKLGYSYDGTVMVANSGDAITPAGSGSFSSTNACINPEMLEVDGGSTLRFYTTDTSTTVTVSFYSF